MHGPLKEVATALDDAEVAAGPDRRDEWLDLAREAAVAGKPLDMVEALYRSTALDGLARRMQWKWRVLSPADIEDVVGEAVDVLFDQIKEGTAVTSLVGFLWKVADRKASDLHRARQRTLPMDLEAAEAEGRLARAGARPVRSDVETGVPEELDPEEARKWAIAAARELLPRLGQKNVQDVMAYVLDAIERGFYEVSNREIGEALGLTLDTVRTSLSRGFRRLARAAREAGIADLVLDLEEIGSDEESDEEDDE